jgi:hypothetical protein
MFKAHDAYMIRLLYFCLVCIVLCGSLVFLFFAPQVVQAGILYSDAFSRQELESWQVVRNFQWQQELLPCMNQGQPASWQIMLEQLGIQIFGPGCFTEIIPTDFVLPLNTSYKYSFDITMPVSVQEDRNYTVRYIDPGNTIAFKLLGDQIYLEKAAHGQGWTIPGSRATYIFRPDKTYRIRNEIRTDHSIKVYIDDELVLDFYDQAPYLDGGTVGFRASVGSIPQSEVWFDNVVVEELSYTQLDVPYFSQRDSAWSRAIYDNASSWFPIDDSIERWGCALVSATMMLRFHGIQTLPSGEILTPLSLNYWLQAQPDGFIGSGLLNWISLTRLVREYREQYPNQYTLEYRKSVAEEQYMQSSIEQGRPFIVQLPNHFSVAKGIKELSPLLLSILDPFTAEHTEINAVEVESIREFIPSNTDLRYILFTAPDSVEITIDTTENVFHSTKQTTHSHPQEDFADTGVQVVEIPKPIDGEHRIILQTHQIGAYKIQVFFYNDQADVEIIERILPISPQGLVLWLSYQSGTTPSLRMNIRENLVLIVDSYWELGKLRTKEIYLKMRVIAEEIVRRIEINNVDAYDRAKRLFIQTLHQSGVPEDLWWPLLDSDQ